MAKRASRVKASSTGAGSSARTKPVAARARSKKPVAKGAKPRKAADSRRATDPTLLAGGNPQIAKGNGEAPVRAFLDAMPGWKRAIGRRLDAIIGEEVTGVRKAVRWNTPFYGIEGMGWFLSMHCVTKYVKVGFFSGASLTPMPPFASTMRDVRYMHYFEGETINEGQFRAWVRQAAKLPGMTCF